VIRPVARECATRPPPALNDNTVLADAEVSETTFRSPASVRRTKGSGLAAVDRLLE